MIHEHDVECASFCSAALPPERQPSYEWAANPYGPSCDMYTEQDSYDPNGVADYDNDNDSYESSSEDPFGDYERDLFMESAEDYQRFN